MNSQYTITIEPPESVKAPMWSASCEETGLVSESKTPGEALIALLDAHRIVAEEKKQSYPLEKITFSLPSLAV